MNLIIYISYVILSAQVEAHEDVTEDYINKFAEEIEEFKKSTHATIFKDEIFDAEKYDEHDALQNAETYDFIVVGAGVAGSTIASRLSEIPEWKVLLLEAGDAETPIAQVPGLSGLLQTTKYNWGYVTEPQENWCLGMIEHQCTIPSGKALGGGSAINDMVYTRGNARDYDLWDDQGNEGWCYNEVLPYFKKAEDCALKKFDRKYHHQGGPLHVEETQYDFPLIKTFLEAGKELGYKTTDYNGHDQIGFSKAQAITKHGRRNSAAQSYLQPYKNRKNLHIKSLSHVVEIIIKSHTKEAAGVKYVHNHTMYIAKADKEIIVSAGPFNSAQLLMLSGIGPKEDLEKLEIPVINDLQVGRRLKDHIAFHGLNFVLNVSKFDEGNPRVQLQRWLKNGNGPLAIVAASALAYVKTKASKDEANYPDVELLLDEAVFVNYLGIKEDYKHVQEPEGHDQAFRIAVMPTHPKSVGSIRLKSKDPFHGPIIDPMQLSDPEGHDIETMLAGIKKAIEIVDTKPFRKLGAHLHTVPVKECAHFEFGSDDYWKCAARYLSISLRHQTGTCKMGPRNDEFAVVDNKLRVHGIHKLRVADSSVIPIDITGHTHAVANMIGEKASDLIKQHWM